MSQLNLDQFNITEDTKTPPKTDTPKIIHANDVVFKVLEKEAQTQYPPLQNISGISEAESKLFQACYPLIENCKTLFETFSSIPYSIETYMDFEKKLWQQLNHLHQSCHSHDDTRYKSMRVLFRGSLFNYLSQSVIACRAFARPFGYPGDYVMLQYLYDYEVKSKTHLGNYLDMFFLRDTLALAVVDRVNTMSKKVLEFIQSSNKSELHILNIASGSGFDLINIAKTRHDKAVTIHCFDQEVESLRYVKEKIKKLNVNTEFKFYKADIRNFFRNWANRSAFDYVYNIGLADYLPDKILKKLMQSAIDSLNPGGKFVIAHKDYENFPYHHPAFLYEWNFIQRTYIDYLRFIDLNLTNYSHVDYFYESDKKVIYFGEFTK